MNTTPELGLPKLLTGLRTDLATIHRLANSVDYRPLLKLAEQQAEVISQVGAWSASAINAWQQAEAPSDATQVNGALSPEETNKARA